MKITIDENVVNDDEIIIKCSKLDDRLLNLISIIQAFNNNIIVNDDGEILKLDINKILYFESVDKKIFVYTIQKVYEIFLRLYEIEQKYTSLGFFRASKSFIVNLDKVISIKPMLGSRLESLLENNEKIIVSRKYVKNLKSMLDDRKD